METGQRSYYRCSSKVNIRLIEYLFVFCTYLYVQVLSGYTTRRTFDSWILSLDCYIAMRLEWCDIPGLAWYLSAYLNYELRFTLIRVNTPPADLLEKHTTDDWNVDTCTIYILHICAIAHLVPLPTYTYAPILLILYLLCWKKNKKKRVSVTTYLPIGCSRMSINDHDVTIPPRRY